MLDKMLLGRHINMGFLGPSTGSTDQVASFYFIFAVFLIPLLGAILSLLPLAMTGPSLSSFLLMGSSP